MIYTVHKKRVRDFGDLSIYELAIGTTAIYIVPYTEEWTYRVYSGYDADVHWIEADLQEVL